MEDEIEKLKQRIGILENALKPFVQDWEFYLEKGDHYCFSWWAEDYCYSILNDDGLAFKNAFNVLKGE